MTTFEIKDMTCGHCVGVITKAVKAVDANAVLQIDLATHRVDIDAPAADSAHLSEAIQQAGYTPVLVEAPVEPMAAKATPARGGCCCG